MISFIFILSNTRPKTINTIKLPIGCISPTSDRANAATKLPYIIPSATMYKTVPTIPAIIVANTFLTFIILSLLLVKNKTSIGFIIIVAKAQFADPVSTSAMPAPTAAASAA